MRFKLDENIGAAGAEILRAAGHDVSTVHEQGLDGVADDVLLSVFLADDGVYGSPASRS